MPVDLLSDKPKDLLAASAKPKQPEEESIFSQGVKSVGAGIAAFGNQAANLATGTLDLAAAGVGALGSVIPGAAGDYLEKDAAALRQRIAGNVAARQQVMSELGEKYPISTTVGAVGGAIGTSLGAGRMGLGIAQQAIPGVAAKAAQLSPVAKAVAAGGGGGAAMGYLDYAPTQEERISKGLLSGAIGSVAAPVGLGLAKGAKAVGQYIKPEKAAVKDLAGKIKAEGLEDPVQAAKPYRGLLGETPTPGQAYGKKEAELGSSLIAAEEAGLGVDEATKLGLASKATGVVRKARGQLDKTLERMAPKGTRELRDRLYKNLGDIDEGVVKDLKKNPVLLDELTELKKSKYSELKDLPDTSVAKLDAIKKNIDTKLRYDVFGDSKLDYHDRAPFLKAKRLLTKSLDQKTEYAKARKLAQKTLIQEQYQDMLSRYAGKNPTIKDMNRILFSKANRVDQFLEDVKVTGGDVKKAKQLITVFRDLADDPVGKVIKRQREVGMPVSSNQSAMLDRLMSRLTADRYKKAVANLMTDDKWPDKVSAIMKQKGNINKKIGAVRLLLELSAPANRAGAVGIARKVNEE